MLKILYAGNDNLNSKIQLNRFLKAIDGEKYLIKIAAYKKSSPNCNIDWTLDPLHNFFDKEKIYLDNEYFITYYNQIKYYNPDIIISDLEYFTSYIANDLGITLWQYSSSMLNYGLTWSAKYNVNLFSKYAFIFNRRSNQKYVNILDNSNLNLVCSHFGDTEDPPELKENFEWIRPYHSIGFPSIPCRHNIVAGLLSNNKKCYKYLNKSNDCVVFSTYNKEKYSNLIIKDIDNEEEYACNLKNCNLFFCEGQTSLLADAFYNNKFSVVAPNLNDPECIINSMYSEKLKLSVNMYSDIDWNELSKLDVAFKLNNNIDYLHERLEKI